MRANILTAVYGVDAWEWPAWRRQLAWEDADAVLAWKRLRDHTFMGQASGAQVFDVALVATRSEEFARKIAGEVADRRMAKGLPA